MNFNSLYNNIQMRHISSLILLLILVSGYLLISQDVFAAEEVLILHSYSSDLERTQKVNAGLNSVFADLASTEVNLHYEYMDSSKLSQFDYLEQLFEIYRNKYLQNNFDLIIAVDNAALNFMFKYGRMIFTELPVVFTGIDNYDQYADIIEGNPNYVGIREDTDIEANLNLIEKLHPQTKDLIIAGLTSSNDFQEVQKNLPDLAAKYQNLELILNGGNSLDELIFKLNNTFPNGPVLLLTTLRDNNQEIVPYAKAPEFIYSNTERPIYVVRDIFLDHNVIGGKVTSAREQGKKAGELAVKILDGSFNIATDSAVHNSQNQYTFDYTMMNKFDIRMDKLPDKSILINEPQTFFAKNAKVIINFAILIVILVVILIYFVKNNFKLKHLQKKLREEKDFNHNIIETARIFIATINRDDKITSFNSFAEEITGYNREEVVGENWYDLFSPKMCEHARETTSEILFSEQQEPQSGEIQLITKTGDRLYIDWDFARLTNHDQAADNLLLLGTDITEQKHVEGELDFQIYHDSLTGLPNLRYFREKAEVYLEEARNEDTKLAVFVMDINNFNIINNTLGHLAGDKILLKITSRINENLEEKDLFARMGGDQFVFLFKDFASTEDVIEYAYQVLQCFEDAFQIASSDFYLKASIGISLYPDDAANKEDLLKQADVAMHRAKENVGNQFGFYNADMNQSLTEFVIQENSLRKAIENEDIVLFYQPIIDLTTEKIVGAEALVRWYSEEKGLISPAEFIPFAEDTGLIIDLGEYVLRKAAAQIKDWEEKGYQIKHVSVNLSVKQLQQQKFVNLLNQIIDESGIRPGQLALEITESTAIEDINTTHNLLLELRDNNMQILLDDFGTGFSSLNYLTKLPITVIKIDRSFIFDIFQDEKDQRLVEAIIAVSHRLGYQVVAEGVETKAQLDFLRINNCDMAQGYYFDKPLPADQFEKSLYF